jgi:hypothetical protein
MTDLIKKKQELINQALTKENREKSLEKKIAGSLLSKIKVRSSDKILLIDTSGSMGDTVKMSNDSEWTTRYKVMCGILENLEGFRRFSFNDSLQELRSDEKLPSPAGGTSMHGAFRGVKNKGIKHIILVSDGLPDSKEAALREANGLKIDVVYIGPQPMPEFLQNLAKGSGGTFENIELISKGATSLLENKIKGLLNG